MWDFSLVFIRLIFRFFSLEFFVIFHRDHHDKEALGLGLNSVCRVAPKDDLGWLTFWSSRFWFYYTWFGKMLTLADTRLENIENRRHAFCIVFPESLLLVWRSIFRCLLTFFSRVRLAFLGRRFPYPVFPSKSFICLDLLRCISPRAVIIRWFYLFRKGIYITPIGVFRKLDRHELS